MTGSGFPKARRLGDHAASTPTRPGGRRTRSRAQVADPQGDLMLWCPELAPKFTTTRPQRINGRDTDVPYDPVLQMYGVDDRGATPHGVHAGWIWTVNIGRHPKDQRAIAYDRYRRQGFTHWPLHVPKQDPGAGYHGLFHISAEAAADHGRLMNQIAEELLDAGLSPGAAGVAPGAPMADGLNPDLFEWAMVDWDNDRHDDEARLRILHETFPRALLFLEMPEGQDNLACVPWRNGLPVPKDEMGAWIRKMRQQFQNFTGFIHEVSVFGGLTVDDAVRKYTFLHGYCHDLPEWAFEQDTYEKFWQGGDEAGFRDRADEVLRRCPWLKGSFSGATPHPPPPDEAAAVDGGSVGDQIDPASIACFDMPALATLPRTATVTKLVAGREIAVDFTKRHGPRRWPDVMIAGWDGPIQFSLGIVCKVNGRWCASAPIEYWNDRPEAGGQLQRYDGVISGVDGRVGGTIETDWFYDHRWGPLFGYQPKPGEEVGVFVHAGSSRNNTYAVHERSNIVLVRMPQPGAPATWTWTD